MTATATPTQQGQALVAKLHALGVDCALTGVRESPQLVRYELQPARSNVAMRDFRRLDRADDIAYALGARSVRIIAPIPGKHAVGVEVDRHDAVTIPLEALPPAAGRLEVPIGVDMDGQVTSLPICEAPHTLVAGQTGAGKSILLHVIIRQLMRSYHPRDCQLVLIDPKRVEFASYANDPHLAAELADGTDAMKQQLEQLVAVMDGRYRRLEESGARDIGDYNLKTPRDERLPYIVLVADEIAELVMTTPGAEGLLVRLAQKGRAAGIHLILATQYPKAEVITGLLRVNVATKIALRVPDKTASRVIMGQNGAEELLGKGDALLSLGGLPPVRFQTALVSDSPPPCAPRSSTDVVTVTWRDSAAEIASQRVAVGTWQWSGKVTQRNATQHYAATMPRNVEEGDVIHMLCRHLLGPRHVRADRIESGWRVAVSTDGIDWQTLPATLRFYSRWGCIGANQGGKDLLLHLAPEDVRTAAEVVAAAHQPAEPQQRKTAPRLRLRGWGKDKR